MSSRLLEVKYGIPQPEKTTQPRFKAEGITTLSLNQFPANVMPSGGLSGVVSVSEMYMVKTNMPTAMTWQDSTGKVIGTMSGTWSMIGRYPWEITLPGIYDVIIRHKGSDAGTVSFEVV